MPKTNDTDATGDGEEAAAPTIQPEAPPSESALTASQAFDAFVEQYGHLWEGKLAADHIAFYSTHLKELFGSL